MPRKKTIKKEVKKEAKPVKAEKKEAPKEEKYFYGLGRRKSSVAQVKVYPNEKAEIIVNQKPYKDYFAYFMWWQKIEAPLKLADLFQKAKVEAKVKGGGVNSQVEAIRLGISRAILKHSPDLKKSLRVSGLLTRDPREKERKKPGLKRARRAPQWQKR